jgi:hypothetical protein
MIGTLLGRRRSASVLGVLAALPGLATLLGRWLRGACRPGEIHGPEQRIRHARAVRSLLPGRRGGIMPSDPGAMRTGQLPEETFIHGGLEDHSNRR